MSLFDIIFRIDEICKKYDKYDIDKQRELNAHGDDAFARLYATFEDQIDSTIQVPYDIHCMNMCVDLNTI